jgi:hypothetical protein
MNIGAVYQAGGSALGQATDEGLELGEDRPDGHQVAGALAIGGHPLDVGECLLSAMQLGKGSSERTIRARLGDRLALGIHDAKFGHRSSAYKRGFPGLSRAHLAPGAVAR